MRGFTLLLTVFILLLCVEETEEKAWFLRHVGRFFKRLGGHIVRGFKAIGKGVVGFFKGCCGLHPQVCKNEKEFERRQKDIKRKSSYMDREWIKLKKKLASIKTANDDNSKIYHEIKRITLTSETTIEILDPQIREKLNNVTNELKKAIRHKNQTVIDYDIDEIEDEYDKTKTETQKALVDTSTIAGFGLMGGHIKMTADMFRLFKLDQVADFLETSAGAALKKAQSKVKKLFNFHFVEKLSKQNKVVRAITDTLKFYNKYLAVHRVAFNIFKGFTKLIGVIKSHIECKSRGRKIAKRLKDIKKEHRKINDAYNKLRRFIPQVNKHWSDVREQIQDDGLMSSLNLIEDIAKQSSSQSPSTKRALQNIINFKRGIARANMPNTIKLQKDLLTGLLGVKYTVECSEKKLATYRSVHKRCKLGQGSFDELYKQAEVDFKANSADCKDATGLPYTTKEDVAKYVKQVAKKEKFEHNCLLNSGVKRALACFDYEQGYTQETLVQRLRSDSVTISHYLDSCPAPHLTPQIIKEICLLKKNGNNIKKIYHEFPLFEDILLRDVYYNTC